MGVATGTGGTRKRRLKHVTRGIAVGLVLALAACSSGDGGGGEAVTVQQAMRDYENGNTALAKSEFQTIVKRDPSNKYGWYNLGVLAHYDGDSKEATAHYRKTLELDPQFQGALYNLGLLRYQASDNDEAISLLRRAVAVTPTDAKAHWNLGLALAAKGGSEAVNKEATKELNAALKLDKTLLKGLKPPNGATTTTVAGAGAVTTTSVAATP